MAKTTQEAKEESAVIVAMMATPGWKLVEAQISDRMDTLKETFMRQLISKPETMTGRKAAIEAGGIRELRDLKEWVHSKAQEGNRFDPQP